MGKDKRYIYTKMQKSVHRDLVLAQGKLYPLEKTHTPKNAYKRKKLRVRDLDRLQD